MAMIAIVWIDGQPAVGTEYGPGHTPLCCPLCDECLVMIVEAKRGDTVLGWFLFDDAGKCGHILDASLWAMNVTGTPESVTVSFEAVATRPAQESKESSDADTSDRPDSKPRARRQRSGPAPKV